LSSDGSRVLLANPNKMSWRWWDPARGKPIGAPMDGYALCLSPDARMVFTFFHPKRGTDPGIPYPGVRSHLVETETGLPLTPHWRECPDGAFNYKAGFTAGGKRLVFFSKGLAYKRDLIPEERSIADLQSLATALSRHRIDESESFVFVEDRACQKAWQGYQARRLPGDLAYSARQRYEWHVQAASDCLKAGMSGGALHHLDIALAHKPKSGLLHALRAQLWERLGDEARALADLDRAIALEPRWSIVWESRGWLHLRLAKLPQATADFARVVELGTDDQRIWQHLTLLYLTTGKAAEYLALCGKMLDRLEADDVRDRGWALQMLVLQPKAADPARLLAIGEEFFKDVRVDVPLAAAIACHRAGRPADAVAYLERFLKWGAPVERPLTGVDCAWAALIYRQAGRTKEAEDWSRRATAWRDKEGKSAAWAERVEFDLAFEELQAIRKSK
jgi:tetratricopeptide (TPR) repeat protein